uniref:Putative LAGLIDADG homing endonuclease n=1 Tax=Oedogonium cardiacum TaxID=55995 RepID=B3V4M7_OEDCA|nr:putative LAGLIDADG homing endonuclease [Oedogonium cardiacum]ACC97269.1 putative LAGLIDADG homing endonuclease [Oedogonium cardiacum]
MNPIQTIRWNEWLAGITDGNGYFSVNQKEKSLSFEITTHITDAKLLYNIKNTLGGGSVKVRANSQSMRYRIKESKILIDILNRMNGKLYNHRRIAQFHQACTLTKIIPIQSPPLIHNQSAYLAGLIDSYGTITIGVSNSSPEHSIITGVEGKIQRLIYSRGYHQLTLKINWIDKAHIEMIQESYGFGLIYYVQPGKNSKTTKPQSIWILRTYEEFSLLYELLKIYPLKSVKMHRIRLIPIYFKYKQLNYHCSKKDSPELKQWEKFCRLWHKYSY